MGRTTVRVLLVSIASLWIVVTWALISGAIEPNAGAQSSQTCVEDPVVNPDCDPSSSSSSKPPSGTSTTKPPSSTPSRTPSQPPGSTSSPSSSPSATPTGQPSTPPGQSPSSTPSEGPTTPPPPSIDVVRTRVTIHYEQGEFFGRISARKARCERRRVILKRDSRGDDETVGRTRSSRRGSWAIRLRNPRGKYYAVAKSKSYAGNRENQTVVCRKGESRTIRP